MITQFYKYNENLKSLLVGPTEDEVLNNLKQLNPTDALFKCVRKGNGFLKGVIQSVEDGADINSKDKQLDWTPITYAIENDFIDIVVYLMKKGVKINKRTFPIDYILTKVVENGDFEDFKYVLKNIDEILDISDIKKISDIAFKKHKIEITILLNEYIIEIENFIKNYIKKI